MAIFKGAGVAIVTPFREDGSVDYEEFDRLVDFQIAEGTDAIIVCGTTGEAATMTVEEHTEVIRHCVKYVRGRVPVIAGTGSNATATAVEISQLAQKDGVDAVLQVTPYYNKATQEGLIEHFCAVSDAIDIPIILYNVPSRTGCNILPETVAKIMKRGKNVKGIKDATGSLTQTAMTMEKCDGNLEVYSGNDDIIVPMMSIGAEGVISVLSNIAPGKTHEMCRKCLENDFISAGKMQIEAIPLVRALFLEVNPIPVKKALSFMGYHSHYLRLPLTGMQTEHAEVLKLAMRKYGIEVTE
ncbi:MAG: 4-hydroxy-tetrahydrodipicolinate synthase [Lachnospiraceae bacterium]|jgi:dihydrodipicolinate synthase|nr:4-hydroxy-tetrahydrodipicolinate synthase [Lachnospiraceae bacterium]MBF1017080.1 4-hydroxy-tetrahydrodipicolinate synthase [Lachnospiraceae bacterium]